MVRNPNIPKPESEPGDRPETTPGATRRRFLQGAGVAAGTLVLGGTAGASGAYAASNPGYVLPKGFQGDMSDLRHVVILMQENRSLDHYFGTFPGVRGFNDKQALRFQDGTTVFQQKDRNGNIVTPKADDGTWGNNHEAWGDVDHRKWDLWVQHNGASCMNYHSDAYMGFYHAIAAQYTIADQNFCSEFGPTDPNRKYLWSGTANSETGNTDESNYSRPWITVAEQLQQVGIDWRLYSDNSGNGRQGYISTWVGDYGDNELKYFKGFDPQGLSADDPKLRPGTGLIWRGNATYYSGKTSPNDDSDANLDAVLKNLHDACRPGAEHPLPAVSWIVAPYGWSEHPSADTLHGERYVKKTLDILQSNPDIWNHTLFILNYDENDGKFDHVLPPWPEAGTAGEYTGDYPLGFGPRVPMLLVSPWTRGGYVASEVFDHTSTIKFLEIWAAHLGKPFRCPNISDWRRSIAGDLTSALDFAHPQPGPTALPDPRAERPVSIAADHMKARPLSFHPHATISEDRASGTVTARMTLTGGPKDKALSFQVFPDKYKAFSSTPFTVAARKPRDYTWDAKATDGKYAFSIYSNDGFVRSFAGQVAPAGKTDGALPRVEVALLRGEGITQEAQVKLTLHNDGTEPVDYTLTAHDYLGRTRNVTVAPGRTKVVMWPTQQGYYDVVITVNTDTTWTQRYAGRIATI
ncbi:alkaline phosphatase family protein [Streptomyces malaysiensis subsp. malaysiensis]|uniref:alkaline phosphatase family protein n=1 Tax=Streptomyces malaysiensis TaxID=92644 RepID=UPI0024C00AA9|nr:alkaline phosphatase family protein [Streptomyces sp. NA07423]WHX15891.1 alkaline phosphatase family protein [Streptomyces sp. NA07423]